MTSNQFASPYFAAIDLGSNSFHMLVVRLNESKIEIVDREKEMVQIARGILPNGQLDANAMTRALACLSRFSERLSDIPQSQIRAVGTKTLRATTNAQVFLKQAEKSLGCNIQIVSGYEEARLVYNGLSNTVVNEDNKRLVIDIGGGSTEFVIGKNYQPILLESLPLGCVTFSRNYIDRFGGISKTSMRKAYIAACNELEEIRKIYQTKGWEIAFGTSGTMKAIASLVSDSDGGAIISKTALNSLAKDITQNKALPEADLPKLRKEVLPAGIAILQAIFDELGIDSIHVADATLKEGLIYDTIGRFSDHDSRFDTVIKLKSQYKIDNKQAERVSDLALAFWRDIKGPKLVGVSRTKILHWAALLHEVGLNISHSSYHKHGYYILKHSDLAGFGRFEQYILANLVKLHRRKLNPSSLDDLSSDAKDAFIHLLMCLRLSFCLHRRRENLSQRPKLKYNNGTYTLKFLDNYLETRPLTVSGLEKERTYWKNIAIRLAIEG